MRRARAFACLLGVLAGGCSLLLRPADPIQCATQRDCDADPTFANRTCEQGFCVVPTASVDPVSNEAGAGCVSTTLCTQANSGKASVCKKAGAACTPWVTAQCRTIVGDWDDPDAFVIGTILPYEVKQKNGTLAKDAYTDRLERAINLGLAELRDALPGGILVPGARSRKLALLHCDSYFDSADARVAMDHLTDVVGVQAILVGADEDLAAVRDRALAKKVALACTDCVGPFAAGPTAWRIVPPLALEAPIVAWRVGDLEAAIKAAPSPPAAIKVAVLAAPDIGPSAFLADLLAKLRFNGQTPSENGVGFLLERAEDPTKAAVIYKTHIDAIIALAPEVIVVAMGADFPAHYLPGIEAGWPDGKPRPHYVLTALNFEVAAFVGVLGAGADDLRRRVSGARPAFDQALQNNIDGYTSRYKAVNNFMAPDGNFGGYEAIYAMTYAAMAASSQQLLDGLHVSAGFERLGSGNVIDVGPAAASVAFGILGSGGTIDLRGLLSNLDWSVATRDLAVDSGMYCFQFDAKGNLLVKLDAGPRYSVSTGSVIGTYACD